MNQEKRSRRRPSRSNQNRFKKGSKPQTETPPLESCKSCHKPLEICLCAELKPIPHRVPILILQHPQEPDVWLGTAPLLPSLLAKCTLRPGLSWPNLNKALGRDVDLKKWIVLYLGSGFKEAQPKASTGKSLKTSPQGKGPQSQAVPAKPDRTQYAPGSIIEVDTKGVRRADALQPKEVMGIILIDGTWSQAKTLWWRNAWLLKLRRAILVPSQKSLYGKLRREPKPNCVSTLETAADVLDWLGEDPSKSKALRAGMLRMLERYEELQKQKREKKPETVDSKE